jgi:hypothetical protein
LAALPERVDPEDLARQLEIIEKEIKTDHMSLTALAQLRERVTDLADRSAWVTEAGARKLLLDRAGNLMHRLG